MQLVLEFIPGVAWVTSLSVPFSCQTALHSLHIPSARSVPGRKLPQTLWYGFLWMDGSIFLG